MVWKELEPGAWADELEGAEQVFYNLSQVFRHLDKEHAAVYCVCKIRIGDDSTSTEARERLLLDAWKSLQADYPSLSVFVDDGQRKMYQAATADAGQTRWASETFVVHHTGRPADEIVSTLHMRKLPCLIFLPASSEVIFHSSHWRIDALGACLILDRLFDLVSLAMVDQLPCNRRDLEYQRLAPSLEDAFGSPNTIAPNMEAIATKVRERNFETSYPSAGLPYKGDARTVPLQSRTYAVELTAESTDTFISACKSRGISVTAAIHAASADAVFAQGTQNDNDYSTVVSVNVRPYLPAPYNTRTYACATYVTGITHTVRRVDNFTRRSSQLTKAYRGSWEPKQYLSALRPIYKAHGEALRTIGQRPPASNITISSLGKIQQYVRSDHGLVQVERFRLGSAIMSRQPTLYIWTFRGRLTLSLDFNEAYYDYDFMKDLLRSLVGSLEHELGLDLRYEDAHAC